MQAKFSPAMFIHIGHAGLATIGPALNKYSLVCVGRVSVVSSVLAGLAMGSHLWTDVLQAAKKKYCFLYEVLLQCAAEPV